MLSQQGDVNFLAVKAPVWTPPMFCKVKLLFCQWSLVDCIVCSFFLKQLSVIPNKEYKATFLVPKYVLVLSPFTATHCFSFFPGWRRSSNIIDGEQKWIKRRFFWTPSLILKFCQMVLLRRPKSLAFTVDVNWVTTLVRPILNTTC